MILEIKECRIKLKKVSAEDFLSSDFLSSIGATSPVLLSFLDYKLEIYPNNTAESHEIILSKRIINLPPNRSYAIHFNCSLLDLLNGVISEADFENRITISSVAQVYRRTQYPLYEERIKESALLLLEELFLSFSYKAEIEQLTIVNEAEQNKASIAQVKILDDGDDDEVIDGGTPF